jgi:hypothetical protein
MCTVPEAQETQVYVLSISQKRQANEAAVMLKNASYEAAYNFNK